MGSPSRSLWLLACLGAGMVNGVTFQTTDANSIKTAASEIAYGMMKYYQGNVTGGTPGILPQPYYWWETGAMFGHMIDYWYYTGDTSYNEPTSQAISFQAGSDGSFMPANQTLDEGNDDQVFWAFTALDAAELLFPPPTAANSPSWIAMAQAVFNTQAARWDNSTCGGGLRWQITRINAGYDYKNPSANGGFFQLASRLARYTGNETYTSWAETSWEWFVQSPLFNNATYSVNDGTTTETNCSSADHTQWSYNYGFYLNGLAYLYNHTQDEKWLTPLQGLLKTTLSEFFPKNDIMVEITCEASKNCDTDNYTFKSFMMRWMVTITQLVPQLADQIWPYIQASSEGAAGQCDGGTDGMTCGFTWTTTTWDGTYGVGQQMSALSAIQANMAHVETLAAPYTADNGGTSKGDPSAGTGSTSGSTGQPVINTRTITTTDKAGAGILTALALLLTIGGAWFLISS